MTRRSPDPGTRSPRTRWALGSGLWVLALGCARTSEADRWSYERIIHEEAPEARSREELSARRDALAGREELTLDDAWRLSLWRSETLALSGEELARIRTRSEQILAQVLPYASFRASYVRQDDPSSSAGSDTARSFTLRERTQYNFNVRQPLFSGFAEYYALRQSGALGAAAEEDLRHAKLLLYGDVADVFYAVLSAERGLATRIDSLRLGQERLEELSARARLGITRRAEVLQQEAEVASIQADIDRLRGVVETAWEALRFITGAEGRPRLRDTAADVAPLAPQSEFQARARARRRDLRALEARRAAAEEGVGIARAGYLPSADLEANYYTHREGISAEIDWDLILSLEIPIFEGGAAQARLREARSFIRSAELETERRRRQIELEVARAWNAAAAIGAELASLEKVLASAQENYEIVQAEYRQNITTNIEVLTSFNTLQAARLERDRASFQAKIARARLEIESGALPGGGSP